MGMNGHGERKNSFDQIQKEEYFKKKEKVTSGTNNDNNDKKVD